MERDVACDQVHAAQRREAARQARQKVAAETKTTLPNILSQTSGFKATEASIHPRDSLPPLNPKDCPGFTLAESDPEAGRKGTRLRVLDQDTFDTAIQLQPNTTINTLRPSKVLGSTTTNDAGEGEQSPTKPVAVLNLASERHPGGGWERGALAQEEALCFRSSLYLSLHKSYYPIPKLTAVYSPNVLIMRDSISQGHNLLFPETAATDLPVASVISMPALRVPLVVRGGKFGTERDREITKDKIRVVLKVAAHQGHRKLVLGALGCGAFRNPPQDVSTCFLEVFQEVEFQGGWWEDVVFAVLGNSSKQSGGGHTFNFDVFHNTLNGIVV